MIPLSRSIVLGALAVLLAGCHSVRPAAIATGPHFRILTYNVNWGNAESGCGG
jgi:hypothetical protein